MQFCLCFIEKWRRFLYNTSSCPSDITAIALSYVEQYNVKFNGRQDPDQESKARDEIGRLHSRQVQMLGESSSTLLNLIL